MIGASPHFQWRPAGRNHYCLPVHHPDPTLHLFLSAEKVPHVLPLKGLSPARDYHAYYLGPQSDQPVAFELAAPATGAGLSEFWEINQQLLPGLYGLKIPPSLRNPGYTFVYLHFAGAHPLYLELCGVEYDPYDSFALGLESWIRSTCHEHLTSGLRKSLPSMIWPQLDDWFKPAAQKATSWNSQ